MIGSTYFEDGRYYKDGCICNKNDAYTAPQIHQVLKWLREEKGLHIEIRFDDRGFGACIDKYDIHTLEYISFNPLLDYGFHKSYEEAVIEGIKCALDKLI